MGSRETRVKDTIHKNRKVAKPPLSENVILKFRNLIRKNKLEVISILIAVLTLFFVIFSYYESRMPELIYTEEWEGGPMYSFSLSNPSGGIAVVEKIWLEIIETEPIEKLYVYPSCPDVAADMYIIEHDYDIFLSLEEHKYVLEEKNMKFPYGEMGQFNVRFHSNGSFRYRVKIFVRWRNEQTQKDQIITSEVCNIDIREVVRYEDLLASTNSSIMVFSDCSHIDFPYEILTEVKDDIKVKILQPIDVDMTEFLRLSNSGFMDVRIGELFVKAHGDMIKNKNLNLEARIVESNTLEDEQIESFIIFDERTILVWGSRGSYLSYDFEEIASFKRKFFEIWELSRRIYPCYLEPEATFRYLFNKILLYEDIVAWEDWRNNNWDIYGYNLSTEREFQITTDESDQRHPAIYGDIIVWMDERNNNWDIYGYNLSTEEEFQITTDESDQFGSAIYGNTVVWTDERNGNYDIYGYNLSTREEFQITTDQSYQGFPAIYGDVVVWADERNGNWDIYGYNLSTEGEFQITRDLDNQVGPAIYEDTIVWQDDRNGNEDIYGYNLCTKNEFRIMMDTNDQFSPDIYGNIVVWTEDYNIYGYDFSREKKFLIAEYIGYQGSAAVYKGIVVWWDWGSSDWYIYGYDLSTEGEFQITRDLDNQEDPAIYKDIVVWEDWRNGYPDIYCCDVFSKEEFQITTNWLWESDPAIYGDIVVWRDERNGNWDIYGYNLSTKEEFQITRDLDNQVGPAIYEDTIVWRDERNNNWDIYGYNLSTKEEFQITTDESDQFGSAIYGNTVVWTDERNGNYDIYGYNLSTKEEFQITTDQSYQYSPTIYGNTVVWTDERNGNYDIYGYNLSTKIEWQITRNRHSQSDPAIYGDLVVWTDERNGNYDIYGYDLRSTRGQFLHPCPFPCEVTSQMEVNQCNTIIKMHLTRSLIQTLIKLAVEEDQSKPPMRRNHFSSKNYYQ